MSTNKGKSSQKDSNPVIYSIHSQKGGVGKTSIALVAAGLYSLFHKKKVLLIDADLTGTSLIDLFDGNLNGKKYFNELILANPDDFSSFTPITPGQKTKSETGKQKILKKFWQKAELIEDLCYFPASPILKDIQEVVSLISQEDHLFFFRHRLEDIIATAIIDGFKVVIIDNPPGLFGLSKASFGLVMDEIAWNIKRKKNGNDVDKTRLSKLHDGIKKDSFTVIEGKTVFVSSTERVDYRALVPSLFNLLVENKYFNPSDKKGGGKEDANILIATNVNLLINKAVAKKDERFDSRIITLRILNDLKKFPDNREKLNLQDFIEIFRKRCEDIGTIACPYVDALGMDDILPSIKSLKSELEDKDKKEKKRFEKLKEWIKQVAASLDIALGFDKNE